MPAYIHTGFWNSKVPRIRIVSPAKEAPCETLTHDGHDVKPHEITNVPRDHPHPF